MNSCFHGDHYKACKDTACVCPCHDEPDCHTCRDTGTVTEGDGADQFSYPCPDCVLCPEDATDLDADEPTVVH